MILERSLCRIAMVPVDIRNRPDRSQWSLCSRIEIGKGLSRRRAGEGEQQQDKQALYLSRSNSTLSRIVPRVLARRLSPRVASFSTVERREGGALYKNKLRGSSSQGCAGLILGKYTHIWSYMGPCSLGRIKKLLLHMQRRMSITIGGNDTRVCTCSCMQRNKRLDRVPICLPRCPEGDGRLVQLFCHLRSQQTLVEVCLKG